jgi:hypothetical protein
VEFAAKKVIRKEKPYRPGLEGILRERKEQSFRDSRTSRFQHDTCIYFVRAVSGITHQGPVKIGLASWDSLQRRIWDLNNGNHELLDVVVAISGKPGLEKQLHWHFRDDWIRGEWFKPSEELISIIKEINETGYMPDWWRDPFEEDWEGSI